jgi:hypothetical protein
MDAMTDTRLARRSLLASGLFVAFATGAARGQTTTQAPGAPVGMAPGAPTGPSRPTSSTRRRSAWTACSPSAPTAAAKC